MPVAVGRALRVIAPNDLRLIWRDSFLLFVLLIMPLVCFGLRWLLPYVTAALAEWVVLEPWYGLILGYILCQQPVLLGYVIGILFIEERDEGTLQAIRATPLSLPSFLGYRLVAGMGVSIALSVLGVRLAGVVEIGSLALLAAASLAALAVPIVALGYAVFLRNKLQAVASGKLVQAWAGLPLVLFFAPGPWQWIGGLLLPMYFPMRLFSTAAGDETAWWLVLPGTLVLGTMAAGLLARFRRTLAA